MKWFENLHLTLDMLILAQENCFLFEKKTFQLDCGFLLVLVFFQMYYYYVTRKLSWPPGPLGPWGVFLVSIHISVNLSKNYWFQLTVSVWFGLYFSL